MKKLIYWYGVYRLCVAIHKGCCEFIDYYEQNHEEKTRNKTNETVGMKESRHRDDTDPKPMNKIGFQISAE